MMQKCHDARAVAFFLSDFAPKNIGLQAGDERCGSRRLSDFQFDCLPIFA
jgi:hypothetical protein